MSESEVKDILHLWAEVNSTEPIPSFPHWTSLKLMLEGKRSKSEYVQRIIESTQSDILGEETKIKRAEGELESKIKKRDETEKDPTKDKWWKDRAKSDVDSAEHSLKFEKEWLLKFQRQLAELQKILEVQKK